MRLRKVIMRIKTTCPILYRYFSKGIVSIKPIGRILSRYFSRGIVSIKPIGRSKGNVLLSYKTSAFFLEPTSSEFNTHTNLWECLQIANAWKDLSYNVDIINWYNHEFIPRKKYDFLIDIHYNIDRLAKLVDKNCVKILHITTAHWLFQNEAEYNRLLSLKIRRGITLYPRRTLPPSSGIECADFATILGNEFTISTFEYSKKPIFRIPISTTVEYQWFDDKDFSRCKKNFLWIGGIGLVHKGLDLVLEAFSQMPKYNLTVCGEVKKEEDFEKEYFKELYQTSNIRTVGWVDVASPEFLNILKDCVGLVYPSCSEGGGGSVVTCMHAGLIPIVSYESSVDVEDFGVILRDCSIEEIKNSIERISSLSEEELRLMSRKAWEFARKEHTRERFAEEYLNAVKSILSICSANCE